MNQSCRMDGQNMQQHPMRQKREKSLLYTTPVTIVRHAVQVLFAEAFVDIPDAVDLASMNKKQTGKRS